MIMALLLFSTVTFSQNKNPIKEGEIIFSCLKKDSILTKIKIINTELAPVRESKFSFVINDSIIKYNRKYLRENGEIDLGDTIYINRKNKKTYTSSRQLSESLNFSEDISKQGKLNFSVKKYKKEKKKIKGYRCHKVIIKYDRMAKDNSNTVRYAYELFVTKKINLKHHPIFLNSELLNDFFPLEIKSKREITFKNKNITKYEKVLKKVYEVELGKERHYILEKISLK